MALTKMALTLAIGCYALDIGCARDSPIWIQMNYLVLQALGEGVGAWSCGVTPDYETILSQPSSP
jgi:hypothetical protein